LREDAGFLEVVGESLIDETMDEASDTTMTPETSARLHQERADLECSFE
jgi:hypothetical protein